MTKYSLWLRRGITALIALYAFIPSIPAYAAIVSHHGGNVSGEWSGTHFIDGTVTVPDDDTLTITAGTVIKFGHSGQMIVNGTLNANGDDGAMVVFTSIDDDTYGENVPGSDGAPQPGEWYGIEMVGSGPLDGHGHFNWCRVRYGGNTFSGYNSNIYVLSADGGNFTNSVSEYSAGHGFYSNSSFGLSIAQSTIAQNGSDGIYAEGSVSPSIDTTYFSQNNGYAALLNNVSLASYAGNYGGGNDIDGIAVSGTVQGLQFWSSGSSTFPFILTGTVVISDDQQLDILAGTIIKSDATGYLVVQGALEVKGTEDAMVVFTSLHDDDYGGDTDGDYGPASHGDWFGITFNGAATYNGIGYIDWCRVRYAGNTATGFDANISYNSADIGYLRNCISEYSASNGITLIHSSPLIRNTRVVSNDSCGIFISGSTSNPNLGTATNPGNNNFSANTVCEIHNESGNMIFAEKNYWSWYTSELIAARIEGGNVDFDPWLGTDESLPIRLVSFEAAAGDHGVVKLQWTTLTESNNYGFEVQRRRSGEMTFATVSQLIAGHGTALEEHSYSWSDTVGAAGEYRYRLRHIDLDGAITYSGEVVIKIDAVTGISDDTRHAVAFTLQQNYPNPFNPATTISYILPHESHVTMSVYDMLGRLVETLVDERQPPGARSVTWNAGASASGTYFCALRAGNYSAIRKLTLTR